MAGVLQDRISRNCVSHRYIRDGESARAEGYLTTMSDGIVKLNDDEIGTFKIAADESVTISFYKGAAGVRESLEYAAEQGLVVSLQLRPEYGSNE